MQGRRTFLRRVVGLGGVSAVGGLGGCLDGQTIDVDGDGGNDDGGSSSDPLDLRTGTAIGAVFTGFGGQSFRSDVDPDEPGGGRLITVDTVDPGEQVTVDWRETIEREVTPTTTTQVGVGTTTPTPRTEIVERSGSVTATGLATAHASYFPMFWDEGSETTETSGIWLSQEAYRELAETRQTEWSPDVLTQISWVGDEAQERIHSAVENVDEDEVVLEAEGDFVDIELTVDGQPTDVQAIKALDTFGNEYIIVADEANPLVVKFTYNAVSVGLTGFDTALWSLIKAVYSGYRIVSLDSP